MSDRVLDGDEASAALLERLVGVEEVEHPASQPVDLPDDHSVEVASGKQRLPTETLLGAVGRRRDAVVDELAHDLPAAGLGIAATGLELPRN